MNIIGEKINGTRKTVAEAIARRDGDFIGALARSQADAGANWLDVNAGTHPDREPEDLVWLVRTVQGSVDLPLCLDSTNHVALSAALAETVRIPMINSISAEPERLTKILPIVAAHGCEAVALAMGAGGIPAGVDERIAVIARIFEATRAAGVPDDKIYVDPLALAVSADTNAALVTLDTIRAVRSRFSDAHIVLGLSNVSFGLPARALANRTLLTLALAAGMDTALIDPADRELKSALFATELLLGRDKHCLRYIRAFRAGQLGQPPKPPLKAHNPGRVR